MMGEISILNVGTGDIRVVFDNKNVAETIRAQRIVIDLLKRGYALLVEVERDGEKRWERAMAFDETKNEYVIADFAEGEPGGEKQQTETEASTAGDKPAGKGRRRGIPADSTKAIAIGRSAGG